MLMSSWKKRKWWLRLTGLAALLVAVLLGLANLSGWLRYSSRTAFVQWAQESQVGLPIAEPAAQAFVARFPPSEGAPVSEITHVTKFVQRLEDGPALDMALNFLLRDQTRTSYVATLAQVERWADASPYSWLAWLLTVVGFVEVAGNTAIEWYVQRAKRTAA